MDQLIMPKKWGALEMSEAGKVIDHAGRQLASCRQRRLSRRVMVSAEFSDLTRRAGTGMDWLSMALFDAAAGLNPHQIDASLFAIQSPLSKCVVLADEVGLRRRPRPESCWATSGRSESVGFS